MEQISPKIEFNLPVSFIKEDDQVVAYTPALDLSTSGKNEAEAKKRFGEIVNIFFKDLIESGNLDEVLSGLGWHKVQMSWNPPTISQESVSVSLPAMV
jgi:hypothetical protein